MALVLLLALVDLGAALSLILSVLGVPLPLLQAAMALALLAKGIVFINDILSIVDIALAGLMFGLLWWNAPLWALSIGIYLAFKGLYSFA